MHPKPRKLRQQSYSKSKWDDWLSIHHKTRIQLRKKSILTSASKEVSDLFKKCELFYVQNKHKLFTSGHLYQDFMIFLYFFFLASLWTKIKLKSMYTKNRNFRKNKDVLVITALGRNKGFLLKVHCLLKKMGVMTDLPNTKQRITKRILKTYFIHILLNKLITVYFI